MAIEGPLRELGIHDVFQLLDLSRKTGRLRVSSALRDNEGTVTFANGRVVAAAIRSNPHPLGEILLAAGKITRAELDRACALQLRPGESRPLGELLVSLGAISAREMERQMHRQIEAVVFELMSWQEGFFSFTEGDVSGHSVGWRANLSIEALLMEGARRIDEWARIVQHVPSLGAIPCLADVDAEHPAALDLRPSEWEVLAAVDGRTDVRGIAARAGLSDFDAAKIIFGLASTGVLYVRESSVGGSSPAAPDSVMLLSDAREALREARAGEALAHAERALELSPDLVEARMVAAQALTALNRFDDAERHLHRLLELDPDDAAALMTSARLAVRRGDLARATLAWSRVIDHAPRSRLAQQARDAMAQAARLHELAEVGADE